MSATTVEPELVRAKIAQAHAALRAHAIDLWLVFLQETSVYREPILDYLVGQDVTWQSAFLYTAAGESIAIVGRFDAEAFAARGCFDRVEGYTQGIAAPLALELRRLRPAKIALNFAADNPAADGLTHGLYLLLAELLSELGWSDRVVSSNPLVLSVRGRKTDEELRRLRTAVRKSEEAFAELVRGPLLGLSERQIAARIEELAQRLDSRPAFGTIVNAGTKSAAGHVQPTQALFEPGDLLHIDFGLTHAGYCADLQRGVYALRPDESAPPPELTRAFRAVADTIGDAFGNLRPGRTGLEIDQAARRFIRGRGYPEYQHALGHQLGRSVHDGGALLGPLWARYGQSPTWPLEAGQVFTLELDTEVPGIGYASLEENVRITDAGAEWLSTPQREPVLIGARA